LGAPTIVIDAGHGGHDRGGCRGSASEKGFNLDVQPLAIIAAAFGFRTVLTRQGDYFVSLDERCAIANRERNAIFRSNPLQRWRQTRNASGIETYYCRGRESAALALALQQKIVSATVPNTRKVRSRSLRVLRCNSHQRFSANLAFSRIAMKALALKRALRDRLAGAIASVITGALQAAVSAASWHLFAIKTQRRTECLSRRGHGFTNACELQSAQAGNQPPLSSKN